MNNNPLPKSLSILGTSVVPFTSYTHTVKCIEQRIRAGKKTFCVAINPEKIYRATYDTELREILNHAEITLCDGIGVAIASKILHKKSIKRCTGCDLFFHLIKKAAENNWRVFLLGASHESNQKAADTLKQNYPGLIIAGTQDGFFRNSEDLVEKINETKADLLFVAMGSPKQELWITKYRERLNTQFCMGVGGTLDVISGKAKRAPLVFRKTGTEFLFRLISQPKRLKRQKVLPMFLLKVLKEKFITPQKSVNKRL